MTRCKDCGQEMSRASTCLNPYARINGKIYKRNTSYYDYNARCHDCNIINHHNHVHHFGCDIERCPRCKGQFAFCSCRKTILSPATLSATTNLKLVKKIKTKKKLRSRRPIKSPIVGSAEWVARETSI